MSRTLLLSTLGLALLSASIDTIANGDGSAIPSPSVWVGIIGAAFGLAALGSAAPQLANGLTALVLLTVVYRLPWGIVTNALARLA